MENKDNVLKMVDKIVLRKNIYDKKQELINKKISFLEEYIKENASEFYKLLWNDGIWAIGKAEMWICYGVAFLHASYINYNNNKLISSLALVLAGEFLKNIIISNYEVSLSLKELLRKSRHLSKEEKKARKMIDELNKTLDEYRNLYIESSKNDIEKLFLINELKYKDAEEQYQKDYSKIFVNKDKNEC